jgi:uncharacterized protein (DUF2236 family)
MPVRHMAHLPRESEKDREFEKLLRAATRLQGTPRPLPRTKAAESKHVRST